MKSIKEKAKEAERNTHPLFESIRESDGKPVSVYDQNDMINMFEAGANYVLECIESYCKEHIVCNSNIKHIIEELKSNNHGKRGSIQTGREVPDKSIRQ